MVKILLYLALFSHNAQQKLGLLKILPSAKLKDEILNNYKILYSIMIS